MLTAMDRYVHDTTHWTIDIGQLLPGQRRKEGPDPARWDDCAEWIATDLIKRWRRAGKPMAKPGLRDEFAG